MRTREASMLESNRIDPTLVVLLNWNGWQDTIECLESLRHLEQPQDILVFDNGSENDSVSQLEEYLSSISIAKNEETFELDGHVLHIVHFDVSGVVYRLCSLGENLGFSAGCNLAVKYAESMRYVYVLLLNNDTVLEPDSLRIMHEAFSEASADIVIPQIRYFDRPEIIWNCGGEVSRWGACSLLLFR